MQGSIHGLQEYKNFHYYFTFSTVIAAIPLSYMPPTIFVMFKIVLTYWKSKNVSMDRHIFTFISINFFCVSSLSKMSRMHLKKKLKKNPWKKRVKYTFSKFSFQKKLFFFLNLIVFNRKNCLLHFLSVQQKLTI